MFNKESSVSYYASLSNYQTLCELNYTRFQTIHSYYKKVEQLESMLSTNFFEYFKIISHAKYRYTELVCFLFRQPELIHLNFTCLQEFELIVCHDMRLLEIKKVNRCVINELSEVEKNNSVKNLTDILTYLLGYLKQLINL